jgi:predicted ATP-grasp superfamily ATP-dependent carboligase
MLYLAKVQNQKILGEASLQLLACQNADDTWVILSEESALTLPTDFAKNPTNSATNVLNEGVLVLADIGGNGEVLDVRSATNWLLELLDKYLTTGITPEFLQQEAQKAEEWRQSLTLQSQALSRRSIEVEARREQIQNLEAKLQQEKQLPESTIAQLKTDIAVDS